MTDPIHVVLKKDAARKLNITEQGVDAMIASGELRPAKFAGLDGVWGFDLIAAMRMRRELADHLWGEGAAE